jgi:hypothetical protein
MTKTVTLTVEMNDEQAWQFAQFLKRVGFSDYRKLSASEDEARTMIEAGELVRKALEEAGYAPR